jgi:voltage-gated potassium channel Kch
MKQISFKQKLRYWFDNTMSRGTVSLIIWLALLSFVLVLVVTGALYMLGLVPDDWQADGKGFFGVLWQGLMRSMDAGTIGGDSGSWSFLLLMLAITLGGIFIFSALIGVLTSGLEGKMDELRKGRSFVVEQDHTVIYGWSSLIAPILSELIIANESRKNACIVILADKDKIEMEDEIRAQIEDTKNTRIVCRSGSPIDFGDLQLVNPNAARSIIVLAPQDAENPDNQVVKTVLALVHNPNRKEGKYHIVAELREMKNKTILQMVGKDEVEAVVFDDLVTRISVQTCRQTGLSVVLNDLMDFGGDEIYFKHEPSLVGKPFGESMARFEKSVLLGLRKGNTVMLKPNMNTLIGQEDELIVLAEDDTTIQVHTGQGTINMSAIQSATKVEAKPEKTLILGWNTRAKSIIHELDQYVAAGSSVTVLSPQNIQDSLDVQNLLVDIQEGDTTDRETLEGLNPEQFHQIMVLRDTDLGIQEADANTLVVLLHLREIAEKYQQNFAIVSEMGDIRNQRLAERTQVDDFIVSDKVVSLVLSQVSENKALSNVFEELFDPEGSEIYLKPASDYVSLEQDLNFYTVLEAARQRNEIVLGYRIEEHTQSKEENHGVVLNPSKSAIVRFHEGDRLVVLAEE